MNDNNIKNESNFKRIRFELEEEKKKIELEKSDIEQKFNEKLKDEKRKSEDLKILMESKLLEKEENFKNILGYK